MDHSALFARADSLEGLNRDASLPEKLTYLHRTVRERFTFVSRIAIALYDPDSDLLKTFIHSSGAANPLSHYQARLAESSTLKAIVEQGRPRVINDLEMFADVRRTHAQRLREEGYGASYTLPMYQDGQFFGFIFFNSDEPNVFTPDSLHYLDLVGHLLSLTVANELGNVRTLMAAIKTASDITHLRDNETGAHLDRMSRYARLIALELAPRHRLSDEFVEMVFVFAPLHDVGKIGIPDDILLKPGKLDADEYAVMKTHAAKGREIIDTMLENFELGARHNADILRNIAHYHHEAVDGSGYPNGLAGDAIPIESRIVAVADVFDALTSKRPYKRAWSNDEAFSTLQHMAGTALDAECVQALIDHRAAVEAIQAQFREDPYG